MITEVTLEFSGLAALAEEPTLLPSISHFRYFGLRRSRFPGIMQKVAQSRAKAGMRLLFLEIVFVGNASIRWDRDHEVMNVNHVTPLGSLVDRLDVRDEEYGDVSDSDDDESFNSFDDDSDEMVLE